MYITTFCEVKIIRQVAIFLLCDFEPFQFKRFQSLFLLILLLNQWLICCFRQEKRRLVVSRTKMKVKLFGKLGKY